LLVNLPPYSCLKIAADVKRSFPHVKLILEFRDEWIENYFPVFDTAASSYKLRMARQLERDAVTCADYVAAVTPSQLQQIRRRYPEQPDGKFLYLPNGYDPELYARMKPYRHEPGKMVITYFGTLYDNPAYAPTFEFLDALEDLPEAIRRCIEVWFIGRISKEAEPLLEGRSVSIRCFGFMPQSQALEYLSKTDYHLMVGGNPTCHAGKLFDYLASGRPMLGVCHSHSELAKVIRETRSGMTVELGDRAGIVRMVSDAFERCEAGAPVSPDWDAIRFFEWPRLVDRMVSMTRLGNFREKPAPLEGRIHEADARQGLR
jgi:glycosyltransferase involved in cell wall biosynthesis